MERLLGVGGLNMDRGAELAMVNVDIDIQKGDMRGGSVPGEVDRIATVELFILTYNNFSFNSRH